jgi:hypothetical protein
LQKGSYGTKTYKREASNQKIPIGPNNHMIQRATLIKDIMIWAKECPKETREAPHDLHTIKNFCIWIQEHKIGSSLPQNQ